MNRSTRPRTARVAPAIVRVKRLALPAAWAALESITHSSALAQDAAEERSQSFQAVKGAVKEDVAGGPLLVAAYAVVWIALLLYVIRLVRQQQRVQADLARLERVLSQNEGSR